MVAMESCKKAVPGKNCQYCKKKPSYFLNLDLCKIQSSSETQVTNILSRIAVNHFMNLLSATGTSNEHTSCYVQKLKTLQRIMAIFTKQSKLQVFCYRLHQSHCSFPKFKSLMIIPFSHNHGKAQVGRDPWGQTPCQKWIRFAEPRHSACPRGRCSLQGPHSPVTAPPGALCQVMVLSYKQLQNTALSHCSLSSRAS